MYNSKLDFPVVILGGDHHNTLAAVRAFGKLHIKDYLLIHGRSIGKRSKVSFSKYIDDCKVILVEDDENAILSVLLDKLNLKDKAILYPCSDLSAFVIDKHSEELMVKYFFPGFNNNPGEVCRMMNKIAQYEFAISKGIMIANSWIVNTVDGNIPAGLSFPCIIKPNVSAFGDKNDITICDNSNDFNTAIITFLSKGYKSVLVQEHLNIKYELCSVGCIYRDTENDIYNANGCVLCKIRETQNGSTGYAIGVNSFALTLSKKEEAVINIKQLKKNGIIINSYELKKAIDLNERVIKHLIESGYSGLFDIEYFVCERDVYLNEINFRQSGNGYILYANNYNIPFLWASSLTNPINNRSLMPIGKKNIDELGDCIHIKRKDISVTKWLFEFISANYKAIFRWNDMGPVYSFYSSFIKDVFSRNRGTTT